MMAHTGLAVPPLLMLGFVVMVLLLSGLNATLRTALVCPLRVRTARPLEASQTFTVLSSPPLASRWR